MPNGPTTEAIAPRRGVPSGTGSGAGATMGTGRLIVAMSALAALILLLQMLIHGHLSGLDEYDDGVYFGSAMQLAHGFLPYRDFGFIQPPFIAVLLSPFALMARLTGTAVAFKAARVCIVAIAVTNTALVGALLRHRSRFEMVIAMGMMAVYPGAVSSAQTVLLEPVLVLLCLLGCLALCDGDRFSASPRRVFVSGCCFGLAASTKIWALGPILIVAVLLWWSDRPGRARGRTTRFVAGTGAGFGVICLPFFVGAPRAFVDQVFITQAIRNGGGYSVPERLADLSGLPGVLHFLAPHPSLWGAALVPVSAAALIALAYRRPRAPLGQLERLALACAIGIALGLVLSPTYYYHYSGFEAPFLALSAGFAAQRLARRVPGGWALLRARALRPGATITMALMAAVPVALVTIGANDVSRVLDAPPATQVSDALSDAIPSHGCLLSIDPAVALLDDRYTSDVSGCPDVVDYLGEERVLADGLSGSAAVEQWGGLQSEMLAWVRSSDALVVARGTTGWGKLVASYVGRHFVAEHISNGGTEIFLRRTVALRRTQVNLAQ